MGERDDCLRAFCKLRRLQEADGGGYVRCVVCKKVLKWNECDGGHFIDRRYRSTEIEPDNVWPECTECNRNEGSDHEIAYGAELTGLIGGTRVSRLLWLRADERRNPCNRHRDYRALTVRFNAEIRKIRKEKGL